MILPSVAYVLFGSLESFVPSLSLQSSDDPVPLPPAQLTRLILGLAHGFCSAADGPEANVGALAQLYGTAGDISVAHLVAGARSSEGGWLRARNMTQKLKNTRWRT